MRAIKRKPKPIQTKAYGCLFRSRLEARYAVAFTEERIEWRYEPEGFDLGEAGFYLPDFWLPQVSMWAEVKPSRPSEEELMKSAVLANQTGYPCLLLIDLPDACAYWAVEPAGRQQGCDLDCGGVAFSIMDYELFTGYDYHLSESRFFACTGAGSECFPMPHDSSWSFVSHSVHAARSARFEHGEAPECSSLWSV